VIIYGATPSGIAAAVEASRMGCSVIILEPGPFTFVPLGEYEFTTATDAVVTISNAGAKGYVAIDAVRFIPAANDRIGK
jgi:thioredoxin reductase